jgi:hypothetical protein
VKRAPRTTEETAFSTRHVRVDRTRSRQLEQGQPDQRYFLLSGRGAAYRCYEGPDDVHVVDRNASWTKPARFLVVLIKDKGAPALVPVK